jgi:hypothetical protein
MDLKEIFCASVQWICMTEGRMQWQAVKNTAMTFWFRKDRFFLLA